MNNSIYAFILFCTFIYQTSAFAEVVTFPQSCLNQKGQCAVEVKNQTEYIRYKNTDIVIAANSSIILNNQDEIILMQGLIKVKTLSTVKVTTENVLTQAMHGSYWVKSQQGKTEIQNIDASDLQITTKNKVVLEQLPTGFENYYQGYSAQNKFIMGVMKPMNFDLYLRQHLKYSAEPKAILIEDLKMAKENIAQAQQMSSELYQQVVSRSIASIEDKNKKAQDAKIKRTKEQEHLKELYRKKTLEQ